MTSPQTSATLTETEDGMVVTLNRWDGVSGYALTRVAINGVWQDYHAPITISENGEYWVQYFSTDFAGNAETKKIISFTIADEGVVIVQNPPVVNIVPPSNPPSTPPFETSDDFPPNLGDETIFYVSPPPPPVIISTPPTFSDDTRISNNGGGQHNINTNLGVHGDPPRISRPPFIRENTETTRLSDVFPLEVHLLPQKNPVRVSPMEYVEHPVAFEPTPANTVIYSPETETTTPSASPLDVTMLAVLGMAMAGAGVMKSQSAIAKKNEMEAQQAQALAELQAQQSAQSQTAQENWAQNQAMQASAKQTVMTQVTQSQANKDFWSAYAIWKAKVAEAEQKRRAKIQTQVKNQTTPIVKPSQSTQTPIPAFMSGLLKIMRWGRDFIKNPVQTGSALLAGTTLNITGVQLVGDNGWLDWHPQDILSVSESINNTIQRIQSEYDDAKANNSHFQKTIGTDIDSIDLFKQTFGTVGITLGETGSASVENGQSIITLPLISDKSLDESTYNGFNQLLVQKIETITGSNPDAEVDNGIDDTTILKYNIAQNTELFHWTKDFRADWGEKTGYGADTNKTIWELLNDGDAIAKLDEHYRGTIQANPDDPENIYGYMYLAQRGVEGGADWFIRNTFLPLVDVEYTQIPTDENTHPNRSIGFDYDPRIQPTNLMINGLHNQYGGIEIDENTNEEIILGTTLPIGVYDNGIPSQYGAGYNIVGSEEPDYGANACGPFNVYGVLNYYNRNGRLNTDFLTQSIPTIDNYYDLIGEQNYYTGAVTDKTNAEDFVELSFGLNVIGGRTWSIPTNEVQLLRLMMLDIPPVVLVGLVTDGTSTPIDNTNNPATSTYGTIGMHPNNEDYPRLTTIINSGNVSHFVVVSGFSSPRQWASGQQWIQVENPFLNTTEYYTWQDFQNSRQPDQSAFWIDPKSPAMSETEDASAWGNADIKASWSGSNYDILSVPTHYQNNLVTEGE